MNLSNCETIHPLLVTAQDAASMLGMNVRLVRDMSVDGRLERFYIGTCGRNYRITVASIQAFVQAGQRYPVDTY